MTKCLDTTKRLILFFHHFIVSSFGLLFGLLDNYIRIRKKCKFWWIYTSFIFVKDKQISRLAESIKQKAENIQFFTIFIYFCRFFTIFVVDIVVKIYSIISFTYLQQRNANAHHLIGHSHRYRSRRAFGLLQGRYPEFQTYLQSLQQGKKIPWPSSQDRYEIFSGMTRNDRISSQGPQTFQRDITSSYHRHGFAYQRHHDQYPLRRTCLGGRIPLISKNQNHPYLRAIAGIGFQKDTVHTRPFAGRYPRRRDL